MDQYVSETGSYTIQFIQGLLYMYNFVVIETRFVYLHNYRSQTNYIVD